MNNIVILIIGILAIILGTWTIAYLKFKKMNGRYKETNQHLIDHISSMEKELAAEKDKYNKLKHEYEIIKIMTEDKERRILSLEDSNRILEHRYQELESSFESMRNRKEYYADIEIFKILSATVAIMNRHPEESGDLLARINRQLMKTDCRVIEYSENTKHLYQILMHGCEKFMVEKVAIIRRSSGDLIIPGIVYIPNI